MKCADIIYKLFSAICAAVTHSLHIQQQWRDMGLHDTTPKSNSIPTFPIRFLLLPLFFFRVAIQSSKSLDSQLLFDCLSGGSEHFGVCPMIQLMISHPSGQYEKTPRSLQ